MRYLQGGTFGIFPASLLYTLSTNEQIVLCWIWFHVNQQSGDSFPSINTLARETKLSRRSVIYIIGTLVQKDKITKRKTFKNNGGYGHNIYKVVLPTASTPLVQGMHHPSATDDTTLVQVVHPNQKNITKRINQIEDSKKDTKIDDDFYKRFGEENGIYFN